MKAISFIMLLLFLASCTNATVENTTKETNSNNEIQDEINQLEMQDQDEDDEENEEDKVTTLNYSYNNTAVDVNMEISYELDDQGKIDSISILSNNYDLEAFNNAAQNELIGLSLEEASEVGIISGSSLTTQAFKEAIKNQL